jgi:hypothetical protein
MTCSWPWAQWAIAGDLAKQAWGGLRSWRRHMFPAEMTASAVAASSDYDAIRCFVEERNSVQRAMETMFLLSSRSLPLSNLKRPTAGVARRNSNRLRET